MASRTHTGGATSSPISRYIRRDASQRLVPGCSVAEHDGERPVLMSNTMLQAYNKMRGPVPDDSPEDPLFEWIRLREDMSSKDGKQPPSRNKRDILRMLRKVDETLSEGNAAGDSPREAVFEINRPVTADHHIRAPAGHDFSTHVLTACCADFEFEGDESDEEESSAPHGRISPCTFLAWSKGCRRWDEDRLKVPTDQNQPRRRPPTPDLVDTPPYPPRPFRYPGYDVERQVDVSNGDELSPCYSVPTSPSLLYEPEGIDAVRAHDPTSFAGRYSRMDPQAGKALRKLVLYYRPNAPSGNGDGSDGNGSPTSGPTMVDDEDEEYSHSKIEALLNSPTVRPPYTPGPGLPIAPHLDQDLANAYATIAANKAEAEALTPVLQHQTARIQDLREEWETLSAAVGIIQTRRQQQRQQQQQPAQYHHQHQHQQQQVPATMTMTPKSPEEKKREERIRKHVARHMEDVQYKSIQAADALGHERRKQETNDAAIAQLERELAEFCYEVGLRTPAEVYDELVGGNDEAAPRTPQHLHPGGSNNNQGYVQNVQEGGVGGHAHVGRDNAQAAPFPVMPLQPIITTVSPRRKSTQTQPQQPSPSPAPAPVLLPILQAGAFSPPRERQTPHNGGEFEDDPLPRLKLQYLEMMRTKSSSDGDGDGRSKPEGENGAEYDAAEYLAVERMLKDTEAFLARLQKDY